MLTDDILRIAREVEAALREHRAVVALESTVIAHGLPRPTNLQTAFKLESIVRDSHAVPATIGVIEGKLCAGLEQNELRLLAEQSDIMKISTRDLPIAVARKLNGGTTVASTSWIAHRAGINVFATGGIGGVHRGTLPDVSADLPELARTPIVVVCSGAKIVLDLPATREWLETHGVTVVGFECDEMPAFYSRGSELAVDVSTDSPAEVARLFQAQRSLGLSNALLVTVPIPEEFEIPAKQLQSILNEALAEAESSSISGRELTPFLLSHMAQHSDGATLRANVALLENNAGVAAQIALAIASG